MENGFFLDEDTSEMLRRLGARVERVDGEFWNNIDKLGTFDAVIIDVTLAADETFALSEQLDKLDIPYLFATHERSEGEQPRFQPFRLCADMKELEFIAQALFESTNFN